MKEISATAGTPLPGHRAGAPGRERELATLAAHVADVRCGASRTVLIAGEAGIGKSMLVAEVSAQAAAHDAIVLLGGCPDIGHVPYAPIAEAVRTLVAERGATAVREAAGPGAPALELLLPDLIVDGTSSPDPRFTSQGMLFEAVRRLLERLAEQAAVVLVLEDLHWADESTLALVSFLTRTPASACLLIATYRTTDLRPGSALRTALPELRRRQGCVGMELPPLTDDAVARMVVEELPSASPAFIAKIVARADGNPFFAEELLAARASQDKVPHTVRDFVLTKVESLGAPARSVLDTVAVAGRGLQHRILVAACGLSDEELAIGVRQSVEQHLLTVNADGRGYAFRHDLARQAVYDALLPSDRLHRHAALAGVLQEQGRLGALQAPERVAELAHHWWQAGRPAEALRWSVAAADQATKVFAFAEAAEYASRALGLWPHVQAAEQMTGLRHDELLGRAADAYRWTGRLDLALELIDQALSENRPQGKASGEGGPDTMRIAALLDRKGRYLWEAGNNTASLRAYEEGCELLDGTEPTPLQAWLRAGVATGLMQEGHPTEAASHCEQALIIANKAGAVRERGRALNTLGVCRALCGRLNEGVAALREATGIAEQHGGLEEIHRAYANLIYVLEAAGRLEEALDVATEGTQRSRELGVELSGGGVLLANAASVLVLLGRWEAADALIERSRSRDLAAGYGIYLNLVQADADIGRGRFARAEEELKQAEGDTIRHREPQFAAAMHAAAAELALWRRDPQHARRAVDAGLAAVAGTEEVVPELRLCALALRAAADGVSAIAPRHRRTQGDVELIEYGAVIASRAVAIGLRQSMPEAEALVELCAAEHDRLLGRSARWAGVAARWGHLKRPYPQAYAHLRTSEAALADRQGDEARKALRAAYALARSLEAEPLLGEVRALAARARIVLDEPVRPVRPTTDALGLTHREHQVLEQLTLGRTNRQIGRTLYISERTAAVHVSHVLAKLGVASRGEAATLAHRSKLFMHPPQSGIAPPSKG